MNTRSTILASLLLLGATSAVSAATIPMTGGRAAVFRSTPLPFKNKAVVKFVKDAAIAPLANPIDCPTSTPSLRITASNGYDSGAIDLPCGKWVTTGSGYKYKDKLAASGGVQTVVYANTKLIVKLKGESYPALVGPIDAPTWVEVGLDTGAARYCGRFESFKKNEASKVQANKGSVACVPEDASCPDGLTCAAFDVVPGPGDLLPTDDGVATWLRVFDFTGAGLFGNATNGAFGPSPIQLAKGAEGPDGVAPLEFVGPAYLGANFLEIAQGLGTTGTVCVKIEQDPFETGWIDCDGGTSAAVGLSIDSNGAGAPDPAVLTIPGGAGASPAGEALVRVLLQFAIDPENDADCSALSYLGTPSITTAFTSGQATATITDDWINGAPGTATNTVTLGGTPLACDTWGATSGPTSSLAAPLYAMDFLAPVLGQVVDVSQVFRLELEPTDLPGEPTPTPTPGGATPTPTPDPTPTAEPTPTPSPDPTPTPEPTPTPMPTATTVPATIDGLSITDDTVNYGPDYQAFGNCYEQVKTSSSVLSETTGAFSTRYRQNVATDCEAVLTGGGGIQADAPTSYTIDFDVTCPAGSTYEIRVETSAAGALTVNRDNGDGCDLPFFGATGDSTATIGVIAGSQTGASLASGNLSVGPLGGLTSAPDTNQTMSDAASAVLTGSGTGAAIGHSLTFSWNASCSSNGDATDTGSECSVRFGLDSDLAPNGIGGCMDADDYPGVGGRTAASDGHFVDVVAECTFLGVPPTPTPQPTNSPTPTPPAPLGTRSFTVATGQGGYCPSDGSAGSFLKTHGSPTGGIPGTVCNGTQGNFGAGPLAIDAGIPDVDGRATLTLASAVVLGANLDTQTPNCGGQCVACWRFEDDPSAASFVDCDGGSNADATLTVDSNDAAAPPSPEFDPAWLAAPASGGDDGAGAAILYVKARRLRVNGSSSCPGAGDAAWTATTEERVALVTGQATTTIEDRRRCSGSLFGTACPSANPYTVSLSGANFDCSNWTTGSGARLVTTFANLDENIGGSFGTGDIAQVLRLND